MLGALFISEFTLGFDSSTGSFGFLSQEYFVYVVFGLGIFGGALYYCGMAMTLKHFSALVLCAALLF